MTYFKLHPIYGLASLLVKLILILTFKLTSVDFLAEWVIITGC